MSTCALLIGIESYPQCQTGLTGKVLPGAVQDVLLFRDWLTQTQSPAQIWLHLSPADKTPEQVDASAKPATAEAIKSSLRELRKRQDVDRLFFYFSGHGFQFGSDLASRPEDVLVCSDFESIEESGDRTFLFGELLAVLDGLGTGEQFYFVDACRNVVARELLSVGRLGINLKRMPGQPSQFALFATMPGRTAAAAGSLAGDVTSSSPFLSALLSGLSGGGEAKHWDLRSDDDRLIVDFESLYRYVQGRMRGEGQLPMQNVKGVSAGELAVLYPPGPEPLLECRIQLEGAEPDAQFTATALFGQVSVGSTPLEQGNGSLKLRAAQSYVLTVAGDPQYQVLPERKRVALFEPQTVQFKARPKPIAFGLPKDIAPTAVNVRLHLPRGNDLTRLTLFRIDDGDGGRSKSHRLVADSALAAAMGSASAPEVVLRTARKSSPGGWDLKLPLGSYVGAIEEAGKRIALHRFQVKGSGAGSASERVPFPVAGGDSETPLQKALRARLQKRNSPLAQHLLSAVDGSAAMWLAVLSADAAWPTDAGKPALRALGGLGKASLKQSGFLLWYVGAHPPRVICRQKKESAAASDLPAQDVIAVHSEPEIPSLFCAAQDLPAGDYELELQVGTACSRIPLWVSAGRLSSLVLVEGPGAEQPVCFAQYLFPVRAQQAVLHPDEVADYDPVLAARTLDAALHAFDARRPLPEAERPCLDPLLVAMQTYSELAAGQTEQGRASLSRLALRFPALPDLPALQLLADPDATPPAAAARCPLFRQGVLALQDAGALELPRTDSLIWIGPFTRFRTLGESSSRRAHSG